MRIYHIYRAYLSSGECYTNLAGLDAVHAINSAGEGATFRAVMERLTTQRVATEHMLQRMTRRGLLRREGRPKHYTWHITPAGTQLLRGIYTSNN